MTKLLSILRLRRKWRARPHLYGVQAEMFAKLEQLARDPRAASKSAVLGESLTRLAALRCRARAVMEILALGLEPGPESSVSKLLIMDTVWGP